MAEKRDHQRINCAEKCLLYHDNLGYCGAIMNISISGAMVQLPNFPANSIMPGDKCSFVLSSANATSFCRYSGRIARVDPAGVGLEILTHEF